MYILMENWSGFPSRNIHGHISMEGSQVSQTEMSGILMDVKFLDLTHQWRIGTVQNDRIGVC